MIEPSYGSTDFLGPLIGAYQRSINRRATTLTLGVDYTTGSIVFCVTCQYSKTTGLKDPRASNYWITPQAMRAPPPPSGLG
jgi:hypothetical protein